MRKNSFLLLLLSFFFCAACASPAGEFHAGIELVTPTPPQAALEIATPKPTPEPTPKPTATPSPTAEPMPTPVPTLDPDGKYIALTYDDGPHETYTARLLDILRENEVRVTFFVQGKQLQSDEAAELLRQAALDGHEIGSHTWSHIDMKKESEAKMRSELSRTSNRIEEITGTRPLLMRPPYGNHNGTARKVARELGLALILWTVDTKDWSSNNAAKILQEVRRAAKPNGIILLHDIKKASVDATESIILWLKEQGYTILTVGELLALRGEPEPGIVYRSGAPVG
ncbi:MAG: polysaccharide deacetylase family protein [Clostridiales bacterium]|nr:polysaccharide deacetylase family protein [Clostridiales bacterium]